MGSNYEGAQHRNTVLNKIKLIQYTKSHCRPPLTKQVEYLEQIDAITNKYQEKKQEQHIQELKEGMHMCKFPSIVRSQEPN